MLDKTPDGDITVIQHDVPRSFRSETEYVLIKSAFEVVYYSSNEDQQGTTLNKGVKNLYRKIDQGQLSTFEKFVEKSLQSLIQGAAEGAAYGLVEKGLELFMAAL